MLIEYHRTMIADRPRNAAFHRALKKLIKRGKTTVADIGSGTGILGFMAQKLGAKEVFFYEQGNIMEVSRKLAHDNRIKSGQFFHASSMEMIDPPKVDLVITETLGNYGFEENIIETIEDVKRFLKPGGVIVPQRLSHFACPVISDKFYKELTVWDKVGYGLDFSAAKMMGLNNVYVRRFAKKDLLDGGSAAQVWDTVDFRKKNSSARRGTVKWKLKKDAVVYGVAVWWNCELLPGVSLSTAPDAPKTHWEQLYFPALKPLHVKKGGMLEVALSSRSSAQEGTNLRWEIRANGHKQVMDLEKGFLS